MRANVDIEVDKLKKVIRDTPYDLLQDQVYQCVANGCLLLLMFKKNKGEPGWSKKIVNETGSSTFTQQEQQAIEKGFERVKGWLLPFLLDEKKDQHGGGLPGGLKMGKFVSKIQTDSTASPTEFSLTKGFNSFLKKSEEWDELSHRIAYESPGVMKMINATEIPIGPGIPIKPIVLLLVAILDSIRLTVALSGEKSIFLTLLVMMEELVTGQWRQFLLTTIGLFSVSGTAIGVMAKYVVNAWMLINPIIRDDILRDMFKGTKSLFIGFLLWAATTFPPSILKMPMESALAQIQGIVQGFDDKVKALEEKGSSALKPYGYQMKLKGFDMSAITKISLEDIQTLQSLGQWELLVCTAEFKEIVDGLLSNPIFALVLDLLNIPLTQEDRVKICGVGEPKRLIERVVDSVSNPMILPAEPEEDEPPAVAPAVTQTGGKRQQTRKIKQSKKPRRQTRKFTS
jgi:hypothetical protein